ncbi:MAG: magnesium/cobalt transporter CorA [Acidobacteriota bacterium]
MAARTKKRSAKAGLSPGTPVYIGEKREGAPRLSVVCYDEDRFEKKTDISLDEGLSLRRPSAVAWINVEGIHDPALVDEVGRRFHLHPLIIEDIVNTAERPKVEDYGDCVFFVLKLFEADGRGRGGKVQQVSLVLGPDYVLSFEEKESRIFRAVEDRVQKGQGRSRRMGADYLASGLLDAAVDSYFGVMEEVGEEIEAVEEQLVTDPRREVVSKIHALRREMISFRRSIWPLRELINCLERLETPLIKPATDVYLRDLYDHTIQIIDSVETYREVLSGMLETYLSSVSNRMNEIMKVLTIIATIFIPITFIVGVYGMNFKFMPEIEWKYGYFIVWGIIIGAVLFMLRYFRKKGWI